MIQYTERTALPIITRYLAHWSAWTIAELQDVGCNGHSAG